MTPLISIKNPNKYYRSIVVACVVLAVFMRVGFFAVDASSQSTAKTDGILQLDGLRKEMRGITYSGTDGGVHISGKPTASSYVDVLGSKNKIPTEIKAGDRLHISFPSGTNYVALGIRAFNAANPDGVWLVKTSSETDFVVPDLSQYSGVAVRIVTIRTDRTFDMTIMPEIIKQNISANKSYLTIIDDDGDIHYKTDVIPWMQSLGISVSSAVTPARIGTAARWMSWEDISYCHKQGGEILCHMYNHYTATQIQAVSDDALLSEFELALNEFRNRGLDSGRFLVYSSSTGNMARVRNVASNVFDCGIKIGGNVLNNQRSDPFALARFRIDYAETEGREDWNYADMLTYVDAVAENSGWGIWMIHTSNAKYRQRVETDADGNVILDAFGCPIPMVDHNGNPVLDTDGTYPTVGKTVLLPMLEKAILYAMKNGVEIVSVEQGYEAFYGK